MSFKDYLKTKEVAKCLTAGIGKEIPGAGSFDEAHQKGVFLFDDKNIN